MLCVWFHECVCEEPTTARATVVSERGGLQLHIMLPGLNCHVWNLRKTEPLRMKHTSVHTTVNCKSKQLQ